MPRSTGLEPHSADSSATNSFLGTKSIAITFAPVTLNAVRARARWAPRRSSRASPRSSPATTATDDFIVAHYSANARGSRSASAQQIANGGKPRLQHDGGDTRLRVHDQELQQDLRHQPRQRLLHPGIRRHGGELRRANPSSSWSGAPPVRRTSRRSPRPGWRGCCWPAGPAGGTAAGCWRATDRYSLDRIGMALHPCARRRISGSAVLFIGPGDRRDAADSPAWIPSAPPGPNGPITPRQRSHPHPFLGNPQRLALRTPS